MASDTSGFGISCEMRPLLASPIPHPVRKLPPLLPDVHKAGSGLEGPEGVADIALADLPACVQEPFISLPLDLAGPHPPLDRLEGRGPQDEAEADDGGRDDGLDRDVYRQRSRGRRG